MQLTFIGADHEVTGSCHFLEAAGKRILVDYGMEQGRDDFENAPLPVSAGAIDFVFLTHAHIDHSGLLPLLAAKGFRGRIYATRATTDLCDIMLRDSAHIQAQEAEWRSRKSKRNKEIETTAPQYTMEHVQAVMKCFVPCEYGEKITVFEDAEKGGEIAVRFTDIGHLLGSASIEVWAREGVNTRKFVFSGDIGNNDQPLLRNPIRTEEADYVIMESTYGDRLHSSEKPDVLGDLVKVLNRTFARGGNVVVPSFAVGRTQELLYYLRKIKKEHLVTAVDDFRVYVDSPLAVEATEIFRRNQADCYDGEAAKLLQAGINPLTFPGLTLSITADESRAINFTEEPCVILSASGMCEAGRIKHHLKHNLWREESTILFVGYQSVGTLGRAIVDGATQVKLFGEPVDVRAEIVKVVGLSGHADRDGLLYWLDGFTEKPRRVFVVHGEDTVAAGFAELIGRTRGLEANAPYSGTTFDPIGNRFVYEAAPVPAKKKAKRAVSDVFERLKAAGARLIAVIGRNEGLSNKDLAKFADQVTALCDKWDTKRDTRKG
ncbi:MAG: MBL fold metallo-hydrolase [Lachnospiraceae bacterium]|nr:MBL fold metallo-hydrolase [Lachnospiraceae bacterium]